MPAVGGFFAGVAGLGGAAVAGTAAYAAGASVASFFTTTIAGKLLGSVALNALSKAIAGKPDMPGIATESRTRGEAGAQSFILGRYATEGNEVAPPYSHGKKNKWLTLIIDLGDAPGMEINGIWIDGQPAEIDWSTVDDDGLSPVLGPFEDSAYIKFHDGSQTAADPFLLDRYGPGTDAGGDRPWQTDMVGRGVPYAILTFKRDAKVFGGIPAVRFDMVGIPLYDPTRDSTAGGSGAHRWADPATWEPSANPMVQVYNILRGIDLPDGDVWGGRAAADDLPYSVWGALIAECAADVALSDGSTEPAYRAGIEVRVTDEPAQVIEDLLRSCAGEIAEIAGRYVARIGPPSLPSYSLTDDVIPCDRTALFNPFPDPDRTFNAVAASWVDPARKWEVQDVSPVIENAAAIAEDGERRAANLSLSTCYSGTQAARVAELLLQDARRFDRHALPLPPEADILGPLDTLSWTSPSEGYAGKLFELQEIVVDPVTLVQVATMVERDPGDTGFGVPLDPVPTVPIGVTPQASFDLEGFTAFQVTVTDSSGASRDAGIGASWDTSDMLDGTLGVHWQIMDGSGAVIYQGAEVPAENGSFSRVEGIVPGQTYYVRARVLANANTDWTPTIKITAPTVLLSPTDFDPSVTDYVEGIAAGTLAPIELENMNVVERADLHPDWGGDVAFDGAVGSAETRNGNLYITPAAADQTVIYTDTETQDLGAVFQSRVTAALAAMFWNADHTWGTWGTWADVDSWAGSIPDCTARLEIRHTQDDPAGSPAWSDWAKPPAQLITARAYQFRIRASFGAASHRLRLDTATVVIDVPDRIVAAEDLAIPPEGLTYTFEPPFMARPAVSVTPEDIADGVRVVVTGKSDSGVTIRLLDGTDTGQAGIVDLLAKGYGRKEA